MGNTIHSFLNKGPLSLKNDTLDSGLSGWCCGFPDPVPVFRTLCFSQRNKFSVGNFHHKCGGLSRHWALIRGYAVGLSLASDGHYWIAGWLYHFFFIWYRGLSADTE